MGAAGVRPPRATTYAQVTKDGDPTVQLLQGGRLWVKWQNVCDHSGQSEEADSQERPLRRGSFTSEKKVRTTAAVSSETRRARRFVPNAERKKKKNYHSSKSVHSEIVFKNGEIKALQTNRS